MKVCVLVGWCHRSCCLTGFLHLKGLTGTFLDTKRAVRVLGSGVVLQLKRCGVVHKRLGALGHAGPAVIEIGARLQKKSTQPWSAVDGEQPARCHFGGILDSAAVPHLSNTKWEKNWTTDPEQWCKLQMFSHKPLKCFVVTQAVTAVIELDEPSCELLLQYSICGGGGSQSGW